jgi:hypothetical protein
MTTVRCQHSSSDLTIVPPIALGSPGDRGDASVI